LCGPVHEKRLFLALCGAELSGPSIEMAGGDELEAVIFVVMQMPQTRLRFAWPHLIVVLCLLFGAYAKPQGPAAPKPTSQAQRVSNLMSQAQELAAQGRLAEAEPLLVEAARLAPKDAQVLTLLAKIQHRIGKGPEALALFYRIVQITPGAPDAHVNLAIALSDASRFAEALKEVSIALKLSPNLPLAHVNRARILADLHRQNDAKDEFKIACRLASNDPSCFFNWALLERDMGDSGKETELLQQAVKLQPGNYDAAFFLARSLQEQSRDAEAVEALHHALAIKPDSQEALYMLSRELKKTDPEKSKELFQEFKAKQHQQLALDESKSLGNEAYVAANKQDWPEAIRLLRKGIETCGDCEAAAGLHKDLGLVLCRNGSIDEGRNELKIALKLNPDDPDVVKSLAILGQ
jgi:tetratricopeptide (TPR) repeat protein